MAIRQGDGTIRSTNTTLTAQWRITLDRRGVATDTWWTVPGIYDDSGELARLDQHQALTVMQLADLRAEGVPDDDPAILTLEKRLGWR